MKTFEKDKLRCGLWESDVFVKDKQNVQAALRILQKEVRVCMEAWNAEETVSTRIYLKMGQYMLRAYTERDLSVQERAMFAWTPVAFLRYWKAWLVISRFPIENHFVSLQTYEDFLLSGHSLIMSMKMFAYTIQPIHSNRGHLVLIAARSFFQNYVVLRGENLNCVFWIW